MPSHIAGVMSYVFQYAVTTHPVTGKAQYMLSGFRSGRPWAITASGGPVVVNGETEGRLHIESMMGKPPILDDITPVLKAMWAVGSIDVTTAHGIHNPSILAQCNECGVTMSPGSVYVCDDCRYMYCDDCASAYDADGTSKTLCNQCGESFDPAEG